MTLDDLVGKQVVDRGGRRHGRVNEIALRPGSDSPEIDALLVGSMGVLLRLGIRGLPRRLLDRWAPAGRVPWSAGERIGRRRIVVREPPEPWQAKDELSLLGTRTSR